jgi:CRP-like cAMP-binding protein
MRKTSALPAAPVAPVTRNGLLAQLVRGEIENLAPWLESVELPLGRTLYEPNAHIAYVYFPTTGSVSVIIETLDGAVEAASIGREGLVGVAAFLYADSMPTRTFVQAKGHAYRVEVDVFRTVVGASSGMQQLFSRYTLAFINQVAQSVACNRLHSLEARCARWLLMMHDRVDGDQIVLTQEALSYMLGVHRPAVTLAAGVLQKAGFIDYSRGKIIVIDRAGLESASCSCYQTVRKGFEALMGPEAIAA